MAYATAHGWVIAPEHTYSDDGYSGAAGAHSGVRGLLTAKPFRWAYTGRPLTM